MKLSELYITQQDSKKSLKLGDQFWVQPATAPEISIMKIAACPPGKHDVSLCAQYTESWRSVCGEVLQCILGDNRTLLVWHTVFNAMDMPVVLNHVFTRHAQFREPTRYHIDAVTLEVVS